MPDVKFIAPMMARVSVSFAARLVGGRNELKNCVDCARHGGVIERGSVVFETRPHFVKLTVEPMKNGRLSYFVCDTVASGEYLARTIAPLLTAEEIGQLAHLPAVLRAELMASARA